MVKKIISAKINKVVKEYARRLVVQEKIPIKKVIIFGSQVKGRSSLWSDIDVCVISPKFKDTIKALEFLWQQRKDEEVKAGLEPIGFSEKDFKIGSSLINEIKKTGVSLRI